MALRRRYSRRLRAISDAWRLIDFVVAPPTGGWDLPRASLAAWVLTHFAVVILLGAPVIAGGWSRSQWWQALVVIVWLVLISGLCARLLRLLVVRPAGAPLRLEIRHRLPTEFKLSLFALISFAALVAAQELGRPVAIGFMSALAFTSGLRLAGLDALVGAERPPMYYVRSFFSLDGLVAVAVLVAVALALFAATSILIGPALRSMEATVEAWLGVNLRRSRQIEAFFGGLLLTPAVVLVCEAVSAVSRYEAALNHRLVDHERRQAREDIAQDIHDGEILPTLAELRRRSVDDDQRKLISQLELRLRSLQIERNAARVDRSIRSCLRHGIHCATLLEVEVALDSSAETLATMVRAEVAALIERLVMLQVSNSSAVGASTVDLALAVHPDHVRVTYIDNGGGFDPDAIDRAGGGMSRVKFDIDQLGGSLWFERQANGTASSATIPIGAA